MNLIKNITKISLLTLFCIASLNVSYANCAPDDISCNYEQESGETFRGSSQDGEIERDRETRTVRIVVTEDIPGLGCEPFTVSQNTGGASGPDQARDQEGTFGTNYTCDVPIGMEGALLVLGKMIRWLTGFALICAVLFLVFNGIRLSTAGIDGGAKEDVKKQIKMTLFGIILLLLSGPILRLIAPWVYR